MLKAVPHDCLSTSMPFHRRSIALRERCAVMIIDCRCPTLQQPRVQHSVPLVLRSSETVLRRPTRLLEEVGADEVRKSSPLPYFQTPNAPFHPRPSAPVVSWVRASVSLRSDAATIALCARDPWAAESSRYRRHLGTRASGTNPMCAVTAHRLRQSATMRKATLQPLRRRPGTTLRLSGTSPCSRPQPGDAVCIHTLRSPTNYTLMSQLAWYNRSAGGDALRFSATAPYCDRCRPFPALALLNTIVRMLISLSRPLRFRWRATSSAELPDFTFMRSPDAAGIGSATAAQEEPSSPGSRLLRPRKPLSRRGILIITGLGVSILLLCRS